MTERKFLSNSHRSLVWSNRRRLGGALVEAGVISDEQIATVLNALDVVRKLAELAEQNTHRTTCTQAMDMRGLLTQQGER